VIAAQPGVCVVLTNVHIRPPYGNRIIAVVDDAVGNVITNGFATVEDFIPPKSRTATALLDLVLL
jgi:hypothetical protein